MDAVAVGVDIGGTKLLAAAVDASGTVLARDRRTTPAPRGIDPDLGAQRITDLIVELACELGPGLPLGIGIAGAVKDGTFRFGANLAVRGLPLRDLLEDRLGVAVVVGNDATVAGWGEWRVGAGAGVDSLVMLTLGTGVGGSIVLGGTPLEGFGGFGGELGHVIVSEGGRTCACGNHGCLEAYASGTALGEIAREQVAATDVPTILRGQPIDGRAVAVAAEAGDELAQALLVDLGTWLGIGAASIVNALDPELVLVGGGMAASVAPWALEPARAALAARLLGRGYRAGPAIELAGLGDDAGVVGAALLAAETR